MKIIHYISSFGFGGIERLVHDLAYQQKKRHSLEVSIGVGNFKGEFKDQFQSLNVDLVNFDLNSGYDINPLKIIEIKRVLNQFEVIHLHGFNLSVSIAAYLTRKKIIYTEHGNFAFGRKIDFSVKLSFFLRKLFFRYKNLSICCNSEFTKDYVRHNFYEGKRLFLVHNGVNLNPSINNYLKSYLKARYGKSYIIGTTSRLAKFKKIDRLILTFAEFIKSHNDSKLIIVGDGVERNRLEKLASTLQLKDKVLFEGYNKDVSTFQSVFDVCVFPSVNEPFGLVAIECLSKKKPVLVFKDGGGLTEIIERFEPKNVCLTQDQMMQRLTYYKSNRFEWNSNHSDHLKYFSLARMEEDYFKHYSS